MYTTHSLQWRAQITNHIGQIRSDLTELCCRLEVVEGDAASASSCDASGHTPPQTRKLTFENRYHVRPRSAPRDNSVVHDEAWKANCSRLTGFTYRFPRENDTL